MVAVAQEEDRKSRMEELVKANLVFWARDLLMKAVSLKIDTRASIHSWSKKIIVDLVKKVPQVKSLKDLVNMIVDTAVESTEEHNKVNGPVDKFGVSLEKNKRRGGRKYTLEEKKETERETVVSVEVVVQETEKEEARSKLDVSFKSKKV